MTVWYDLPQFDGYDRNRELLKRCDKIAILAHDGEFRRDGETPYITHPRMCAYLAAEESLPLDAICAMILHDVIEDGDPRVDWDGIIQEKVGIRVLRMVRWLTQPTFHKHTPWGIKMRVRAEFMGHAPNVVQICKLIDCTHNLSTMTDKNDRDFNIRWLNKMMWWIKACWQASPGLAGSLQLTRWDKAMELSIEGEILERFCVPELIY